MRTRAPLLLGLLAVAACKFAPEVPSGGLTCGAGRSCPPPFTCSATGYCCAPGAISARCPRGSDAGTPVARLGRRFAERIASFGGRLACTHAPSPSSENRLCVFTRERSLFIADVTLALRDPGFRCESNQPGCFELTRNVWRPGPEETNMSAPAVAFTGDLLIFHANARQAPGDDYRGGIFAWHPTWVGPRALTSDSGVLCEAATATPAVWCADRLGQLGFEGRAGAVPTDGGVPSIGQLDRGTRLQIAADGEHLLIFPGESAQDVSAVDLVPIARAADPSARRRLAAAVHSAQFSTDGKVVYGLEVAPGAGRAGPLSMWPTAGDARAELNSHSEAYRVLGDRQGRDQGVAGWHPVPSGARVLSLYLDRAAPGRAVALGPVQIFALSPDRRRSLVGISVNDPTLPDPQHDLGLVDHSTGAGCVLEGSFTTRVDRRESFSDDGRFAFFTERGRGWLTPTDDCTLKRPFGGEGLVTTSFVALGNRGLLYAERAPNAVAGALRFLARDADAPVTVDPVFDGAFTVIEPERKIVVYASKDSDGTSGLYAYELPF